MDTRRIWRLSASATEDPASVLDSTSRNPTESNAADMPGSAAAGNDSEYGRDPKRMAPIQTPPFYAVEFVPAFTNTQGGPRRNSSAQVLDTNGKPIPRFYSAGELGAVYSWGYQGGGNVLECIVFGSIAGEHAAAEKPWS